jgi:hypothetical protein
VLQHPVPDPLLARIGDITVSFALLESEIEALIHSLLREGQRIGRVITAGRFFRDFPPLAIGLYRERHGEDADFEALSDLMDRALKLATERNQITHSVWAAGATKETITRIKTIRHSAEVRFAQMSEDDLRDVADRLGQLAHEVQRFRIRLLEAGTTA